MSRFLLLIPASLCIMLSGCTQKPRVVPEQAQKVIVFSLECDFDEDKVSEADELLHGYLVLGKTEIVSAEARAELLDAVSDDIASGSTISNCFDPHHAIRVIDGDTTKDIVICYQCRGYEQTENGKLVTTSFPIEVASRALLNEVLESSGVPLSPGATENLK
ncbi:MAG: hypothetical protein AAFX06_16630 [Planctomycetota bacterium]